MTERGGEDGVYEITGPDAAGATTIIATGTDRASAIGTALAGIVAAAAQEPPANEATLALPIRAEQPDVPSLVNVLAAQLADQAAEIAAPIGAARLDGLLRTDGGLTAWGYAFAAPGAGPPSVLPTVADVDVAEERGRTIITMTLRPATLT